MVIQNNETGENYGGYDRHEATFKTLEVSRASCAGVLNGTPFYCAAIATTRKSTTPCSFISHIIAMG